MSFKLSFAVIDVPIFSTIEDYFKLAQELKVDGVEIDLGYKTYFSFEKLKKLSREYKVPILSIHQPVAFIFKKRWDEFPFRVAQYFKAKYVAHPLNRLPLDCKQARIFFSWLRKMQDKYKIQILIENMPKIFNIFKLHIKLDESTSNLLKLNKVCQEYGFGFTLDTSHLLMEEPMKAKGYQEIRSYMQNIHLSDFDRTKVHQPLGTGDLNLKAFINHLLENKYSGLLTLEVFGEPDYNWFAGKKLFQNIRNSVNLLRKNFSI